MAKYAKTLAQLGINIQEEVAIINDRKNLERQKAELVEADSNLDKFAEMGASEAVNSIVNNETNRNRIYNLYISRGVAPDQAGVTSAVLWDIVTGNVHLRWEDYKAGAGNVEKGLGSELGLANSYADKRAYKAVLDKNGISVDSYVHSLWERMDGYSNELDDMDIKNEVLSVLQSTPNGTVALQTLYDALGIEDAAEELYSMNKAEIAQQMADIDKRIAENAVAQTEFNKKVQNKIDQLEGKNVPTIAQKSQTTPQAPAKLSEQQATEIIEAIPGGVSYSENKGTTNIPGNPKNQQEISDDEFFGAVKSNNTQAIQTSSLADDEFFGATRANKKKSGNQENSKESNTFVENNDTYGREETDIRRDNIPSLEAGADNSSRVDTVDATGASFSEQSGNNISDGRSDIRVFEQGLGGKHSWSDADNERDLQREVSQRLVEIAEDNGLFIPLADTKNLGEKYQGRTGESTVYIDEAAGKVYKVKNPYAKSALKKVAPQDAIYEHIVHNLLFPEAPYKFEGISKDVDGVRIVLSQPFINNEDSPSQSQIEQALAARGLYPDGKYSYGNDLVSVTDVEGDNVILGEDGTVYFIDPIIKFKKPATEIIKKLSEQTSDSAAFMISNFKIVAPEGTSAERWAAVVEHLKEIIGADNVITDEEQMRELLDYLLSEDADLSSYRQLKTSKGEVYGFTYNGKIYLDPTTMNVEAPIHEYTELWSAVIEKQNPELWAKGKELLKQTNMWKVVNSDPNYKNLSEDLRASETLSRIVAAEAAKKINEVSDSKNLIAKLRAWIRKFWNTLKATFSKWSAKDIDNLTLREFKAMPLRDFIEGVNPLDYQVSELSGFAPLLDAKELEEIRAERKQIEEQAKANGTWLKAPNGQPTNLTPEQWVTVHTRRFKEWFGDWEKAARIEKLRNSKTISISGKEFEVTDDFKQNKKNALKYSQSFTGEYTNADTGATIAIYRGRQNGGVNEVLQHNYKDIPHIQSIAAIPDIIKNSIYVESQPNNDVEKNPDVAEYQCYVCGLNIAGEDYTVLAKVAVDKKGNRYYDHNLTAVEKGKLIDIANNEQSAVASGFGTTPDTKSTTNSQRKYRELLSILQTNASKIVDANGEPMPVYHGTIRKGLHKFYTFDTTKPAWFAYHKDYAKRYTKERNGWYRADVYSTFLNIRESLEIPSVNYWHKEGWGKEEIERGFANTRIPFSEVEQLFKDTNAIYLWQVTNTKEFKNLAEKYGYDGISTSEGIGIYTYAAFSPNQIKSVDNAGYFDPNNDDIRYTLGSEENSLVGIHNISGAKLAKALKMGGLANPSAAVIDIARQSHEGYGEYSFILPKDLVAKKSGKNLGTYDRDAWTPLYPTVIYSHNKTSKANLNKLVEGIDEGLADKIKREVMMKVEGNGFYSGLQIVFLKDKGIELPIATVTPRYAGTIEDLQKLFGDKEVTYDNYKALDQTDKNAVTLWIKARGNKADIERINGLMEKYADKPKLIASYTEEIGYGQFDNLLYGLQADARNSGNPDYGKTIENAVNYIRENNLQEEFDVWETAVISNLGFDEKIQVGWSPSGDRIMRKNTLENVSAYMRKQGKNASNDHWSNSEGKMLAKLAQNFATLEQIRANKHRLLSDVDSTMEIRKRMNQAAQIFMDFSKSSNLFLEEQSAYAYLEDILIGGMNPDKVVAEYNKATKRNISLTEEQKAELKELRENMNNIPVQYFETKFDRPVMFSEFAAVVAPNNMPEVIENQLREAGLNIYKYDPDVEGDRREQTLKATASDSIRFMFVGEKGAAAMDAAEEATIRLDNLAVAREMESAGKDAKSIKLATGWERGADGKWRYEVPDVEVNQNAMFTFKDDGSAVTILSSLVNSEELFAAYPELEDMPVVFREMEPGLEGGYYDGLRQIHLSDAFLRRENPELNTKQEISGEDTIAHEIQHAIQDIEGFARGGHWELRKPDTADHKHLRDIVRGAISFVEFFQNSDLAQTIREAKKYNWPQWESIGPEAQEILLEYLGHKRKVDYKDLREYLSRAFDMTFPRKYGKNGYRKFAGEVEARNVEARMNMTPEQRRESLASETQDVATEDQISLYHGMGVSEKRGAADNSQTPPATAKEKILQSKVEEFRAQLKDNKKNLNSTLLRVYELLVSPEVTNAMETGIGKVQYRSVVKSVRTAIEQSYGKKDLAVVQKIVDKYLTEVQDVMTLLLSRRRLNELTQILNTTVEGYTPQGVRLGKRIDDKTREVFKVIREALAESYTPELVERHTEEGTKHVRKPVQYRLKKLTVDGVDISTDFRLKTKDGGIIADLRDKADDIIASYGDVPSSEDTMKASRYLYVANVLESYDEALTLNSAIGEVTDEISELDARIKELSAAHREVPAGTERKTELWDGVKALRLSKDASIENRVKLRKQYAARLDTFIKTLEALIDKGVNDLKLEQGNRAEEELNFRRGIYRSIKDPSAQVLANREYDKQGKKKPHRSAKKFRRRTLNENLFIGTFAELSKEIDITSIPGSWLEDGWYNQFMLSEDGYIYRSDWHYDEQKRIQEKIDDKVRSIFDKSTLWEKFKAQSTNPMNIIAYEAQAESGYTINRLATRVDDKGQVIGAVQENVPLTIANLLYIRNTVRQPGGKSGYVGWGISETTCDRIVEYVEAKYPEYCQFADWVVNDLLPELYEMQDAIYFKRFNTHLTKTPFYFPIVRDKRFVGRLPEVGEGEVTIPSSVTGNIVERVKTSAKMDLSADMFSTLNNHIKETLDWCAYSELTRKFNMFSTSRNFRNILDAQDFSVDKLKETYEIAIGQSKMRNADDGLSKTLNSVSKTLVAGNIVFNFNAAIKQVISGTAILGYSADPKFMGLWLKNYFSPSFVNYGVKKIIQMIQKSTINPVEVLDAKLFFDNWRWAMENIPTMRARWEGGKAGFEVFKAEGVARWDKVTNWITEVGLKPNAFVDMITCANGTRTVYEYQYAKNIKQGMSKEDAHRDACVKAAVLINETQQSSLDGFLSSFQSGGGIVRLLGTGLGAYQNTSMAFARNEFYSLESIFRMMRSNTRTRMIDAKTEEYRNRGYEYVEANKMANNEFKWQFAAQVSSFLHNAIISNYVWLIATPLSAIVANLFVSIGDEEERKKFWQNEAVRKQFAEIFTLESIAWQAPLLYNHPITKQLLTFAQKLRRGENFSGSIFESPVSAELEDLFTAISEQWIGVVDAETGEVERKEPIKTEQTVEYIVWAYLLKAGTALSQRVISNIADGIKGMVEDGVDPVDIMNILSSPRSITRAIAGEPREGESQKEYLDRMSFVYRMIGAGSGDYDSKWQKERIQEYIRNNERPLYEAMGIDPLEVTKLETHRKAIEKSLLLQRSGNKAKVKDKKVEEYKGLSARGKEYQSQMFTLSVQIKALDQRLETMIEFDSERSELLRQKYNLEKELYDKWQNFIKL